MLRYYHLTNQNMDANTEKKATAVEPAKPAAEEATKPVAEKVAADKK